MIWTQLLFAFFTAIALVAIFAFLLKVKGPWGSFWFFFLIIFLVTFSGVRWLRPAGYDFGGLFWLPSLIVALIIALLLAALTPKKKGKDIKSHQKDEPKRETSAIPKHHAEPRSVSDRDVNSSDEPYVGVSAVFWLLIILLAISAIAGAFN